MSIVILYATQTGYTKNIALAIQQYLPTAILLNMKDVSPETKFIPNSLIFYLTSTAFFGAHPKSAQNANKQFILKDNQYKFLLKNQRFAVFAVGNSLKKDFCAAGIEADEFLGSSNNRLYELVLMDVQKFDLFQMQEAAIQWVSIIIESLIQ